MSKKREVIITLSFTSNGDYKMDVETLDVPETLILECLQNLSRFFAQKIVKDAEEVVPDSEVAKYLAARIKVDREKLNKLLK